MGVKVATQIDRSVIEELKRILSEVVDPDTYPEGEYKSSLDDMIKDPSFKMIDLTTVVGYIDDKNPPAAGSFPGHGLLPPSQRFRPLLGLLERETGLKNHWDDCVRQLKTKRPELFEQGRKRIG
jgi:hypothetical protein